MNKTPYLICLTFLAIASSCSRSAEQLLAEADKAYEAKDENKARELYQKAADMGNREAHFNLAYKFTLTHNESVYHYSEAAKQGHAEALGHALEYMYFRAGDLTTSSPEQALDLYTSVKEKYPSLTIFSEETYVATLQKAVEPGPFDAQAFMARYGISKDDISSNYGIWELAEEASRGGRFGTPDPKLILQLISRGGFVPAELESAVDAAYSAWKENRVLEFNICDFITSGIGLTYCSVREDNQANKEFDERIKKLAARLKNNTGPELRNAFNIASQFIEEKAEQEEMHGGSGHAMWKSQSIAKQKDEYLKIVESISSGFKRDTVLNIADSSAFLNTTYRKVLTVLAKKPLGDFNTGVSAEGVKSVQQLWLKHLDTSSLLFSRIDLSINQQQWKNWIIAKRIGNLRDILWMTEELR